ncbi:MAG: signal peptidase I [Ignavibacteriales bacterium]|nr:signal peptidase I [Ignavibacteriales bacterium]
MKKDKLVATVDDKKMKKTAAEQPQTFKEKTLAFLKETGIVLGLFLVINNFVVASFLVPTGSMENEVLTGELLFVNKFIYGGTSPRNIPFTNVRLPWFRVPALRDVHRGDVIVFVFPGYRDEVRSEDFTFYLKRCVGLPGDTLQVKDRVLYVNNEIFPLPRNIRFDRPWGMTMEQTEDRIFPRGAQGNEDNYGPIVVPKKGMVIPLALENLPQWEVFIKREGHTVGSAGSMVVIDGKPASSYAVQRDYLFGMGDHRDNSLDSRYWGFIPRENLVGTPVLVYFSWNTDIPLYDIFSRISSIRWGRIGSLIK